MTDTSAVQPLLATPRQSRFNLAELPASSNLCR